MPNTATASPAMFLALSMAICFHVIVAVGLYQSFPKIETEKTQTIQLTISATSQEAVIGKIAAVAHADAPTPIENLGKQNAQQNDAPIVVSSHQIAKEQTSQNHSQNNQEAKGTHQPTIAIPKIATPLPDALRQLNQSNKTQVQRVPFSNMVDVFQQKEIDNEVAVIRSDPKLPPLSDYEKILLEKLVQSQHYDNQYPISQLSGVHKLQLEIQLHASGAIKNASIKTSSNNKKLDQAAIRAALSASPYPPPPMTDAHKGFRYNIHILYDPKKAN